MPETQGSGKKMNWTAGNIATAVALSVPTLGIGGVAYYFYRKNK